MSAPILSMTKISLFLASVFYLHASQAQTLYKGSQPLDGYVINYEVRNAVGHSDKFSIVVSVAGNNNDCVTFDADITAFKPDINGETMVKRSTGGCVGDHSSRYAILYTRFEIESSKSKLKSIKFYNLKVVHKGRPAATGGSIRNAP